MPTDPREILHAAYKKILESPEGSLVENDLVIFAQDPNISEARLLGRADVVLRFRRERQRAQELAQTRTVRGRASTQAQSEEG